jgi:starvation-inducible DNA-binding protein
MDELIEQMKVCLASVFALYLKTHYFHWNVEGPNFYSNHKFLQKMYEDLFDSVDRHAEEIRTSNGYAPGSFIRFSELSIVKDETNIPPPLSMMTKLMDDNLNVIKLLKDTKDLAEKQNSVGYSNFLQDRIDVHYKHHWMLRSITKVV